MLNSVQNAAPLRSNPDAQPADDLDAFDGSRLRELRYGLRADKADDAAAARSRSDDAAGRLAEKMLQGWTMLEHYCP